MYDILIRIRNTVIHRLYVSLLKPFFFARDPEAVHDRMIRSGIWLGKSSFRRVCTSLFFGYRNKFLQQEVCGIPFANPVGLSAGFDKNGELADIFPAVGFGFAEIGSITGLPCAGNEGTRLWRLPKSKGLVVYYGLKNDGADVIAERLSKKKFAIPIGLSVASTNCVQNTDIDRAIDDMAHAFRTIEPLASYITVNISCPNTQTGQPFLKPENFEKLFIVLDQIPTTKPIFIKLSPDLLEGDLEMLLKIADSHRIQGIICANLTKRRDEKCLFDSVIPEVGGISGKVVQASADKLLSYIYQQYRERFVLVGCGGVFCAKDAYEKICHGASLVQMITGMIYEGPQVVSEINRELVRLAKADGFSCIGEAIGSAYKGRV